MFGTGLIYLMFDTSIEGAMAKAAVQPSSLSRIILGVQVCGREHGPHVLRSAADSFQVGLVGLSMLVTRSSVASLQARTGLPLGTQVIGWLVLGLPFLEEA